MRRAVASLLLSILPSVLSPPVFLRHFPACGILSIQPRPPPSLYFFIILNPPQDQGVHSSRPNALREGALGGCGEAPLPLPKGGARAGERSPPPPIKVGRKKGEGACPLPMQKKYS